MPRSKPSMNDIGDDRKGDDARPDQRERGIRLDHGRPSLDVGRWRRRAGVMPAACVRLIGDARVRRSPAVAPSAAGCSRCRAEDGEIDDREGDQRGRRRPALRSARRSPPCAAHRRPCRAGGRPRWSPSRRSPRRSPPAPSPARRGAASASCRACPRTRAPQARQAEQQHQRGRAPTMMRNDQNTIGTGGHSSRGKSVSPGSGASGSWLQDQRAGVRDLDLRRAPRRSRCRAGRTGSAARRSGSDR